MRVAAHSRCGDGERVGPSPATPSTRTLEQRPASKAAVAEQFMGAAAPSDASAAHVGLQLAWRVVAAGAVTVARRVGSSGRHGRGGAGS